MSNVTITIGGRDYTVACDPGEERHVRALGQLIAEKLIAMPGNVTLSETRSLLFAALLLADELNELRQAHPAASPAAPESETRSGASHPQELAEELSPELAHGLETIAERLENIAAHLEGEASSA